MMKTKKYKIKDWDEFCLRHLVISLIVVAGVFVAGMLVGEWIALSVLLK